MNQTTENYATATSSGLERDARQQSAGDAHDPGQIALGVIIGRTSEFFDFFVYCIASVLVFPQLLFPAESALTGMFAGIVYWFPKAFGFKLDEFWGKMSFWLWTIGFYFAFMPLYVLGLMGITRRMSQFDDPSLQIWFIIAAFGALLIAGGIGSFIMSIVVAVIKRDKLRDETGDPWGGRTLEWSTSSPPPAYNFAFTPVVHDLDAWADMKKRGYVRPTDGFLDIHMPKNTGAGFILAAISLVLGFALIWHIWWLVVASFIALIGGAITHTFNYNRDYHIPAAEVVETEAERTALLAKQQA